MPISLIILVTIRILPTSIRSISSRSKTLPHPIDKRIALTVIHILRQFFSRNENAMIMICDNLDGKEQKREMLFSRWFMQYNEEAYGNTMLRQLRMITCCMYLCSCIGTTQMPDSLSMLFIIW